MSEQLDAETNSGEGEGCHVGNALEELVHIQVHSVTSRRQNHRQTLLGESLSETAHLIDSALQVRLLLHLEHTDSAAHDVASAQTSVRVVSVLENLLLLDAGSDLELLRGELLAEQTLVSESQNTTNVHQTVLLQRHGEGVSVLEALLENVRNGPLLVGLLELLDEARVLDAAASVEDQRQVVLLADGAHLLDVGKRHRLTSTRVVGDGQEDEGDRVHSVALDHLLQTLRIHVTLEGVLRPDLLHGERIVEILGEQVHGLEQVVASVSLRSIEETVRGDQVLDLVARALHQHLAEGGIEKILSATALRADKEVGTLQLEDATVHEAAFAGSQQFLDQLLRGSLVGQHLIDQSLLVVTTLEEVTRGVQEAVVSMVSTVRLISTHQSAPLDIGHRGRTRIRQIVDRDHGRGEREHVVLRLLQDAASLLHSAVTTSHFTPLCLTECYGQRTGRQ